MGKDLLFFERAIAEPEENELPDEEFQENLSFLKDAAAEPEEIEPPDEVFQEDLSFSESTTASPKEDELQPLPEGTERRAWFSSHIAVSEPTPDGPYRYRKYAKNLGRSKPFLINSGKFYDKFCAFADSGTDINGPFQFCHNAMDDIQAQPRPGPPVPGAHIKTPED